MANNIIAYIGYESFDIILYLSRILQKLDRRVLIVDYSETASLTYSIPQIDGIDTSKNIMTFRQVDFTRVQINQKMVDEYDDVLISCGFHSPQEELRFVTKIIYVTNMFKFNLNKLYQINDGFQVKREFLIREAADFKISVEYMTEMTGKQFTDQEISILYRDDKDYENSLLCHYNQSYRFMKISGMMREYLLKAASELCGLATEKQILAAYAKARKGE